MPPSICFSLENMILKFFLSNLCLSHSSLAVWLLSHPCEKTYYSSFYASHMQFCYSCYGMSILCCFAWDFLVLVPKVPYPRNHPVLGRSEWWKYCSYFSTEKSCIPRNTSVSANRNRWSVFLKFYRTLAYGIPLNKDICILIDVF